MKRFPKIKFTFKKLFIKQKRSKNKFVERNFRINPLSKDEIEEICQKNYISYADVLDKQLEDCVWIDHPHCRLNFFEKIVIKHCFVFLSWHTIFFYYWGYV